VPTAVVVWNTVTHDGRLVVTSVQELEDVLKMNSFATSGQLVVAMEVEYFGLIVTVVVAS
jgi:hypothetical protein